MAGEQDGERGQRHVPRRIGGDLKEDLRVGDDEPRLRPEPIQRGPELVLLRHNGDGVALEQVADRLLLRQDQPAFGRGFVDRHDQHDQIARRHEVADEPEALLLVRKRRDDGPLQLRHAAPVQSAECHAFQAKLGLHLGKYSRPRVRIQQRVDFIHHAYDRDLPLLQFGQQLPIKIIGTRQHINHQQGEVGAVDQLPRFLLAPLAKLAFVVQPGGINQHHWSQRQQFHRFVHRVGGRPPHRRDDGNLLSR